MGSRPAALRPEAIKELFWSSSLRGGSGAPEERLANLKVAPPGAPRGVIRSPTRPLFLPFPVLESRGSGHAAMQHPAPGLLPRGALLRNAVPAPDRGSVAAPPTAPEKCRSARSGPSSSSGISELAQSEKLV